MAKKKMEKKMMQESEKRWTMWKNEELGERGERRKIWMSVLSEVC